VGVGRLIVVRGVEAGDEMSEHVSVFRLFMMTRLMLVTIIENLQEIYVLV